MRTDFFRRVRGVGEHQRGQGHADRRGRPAARPHAVVVVVVRRWTADHSVSRGYVSGRRGGPVSAVEIRSAKTEWKNDDGETKARRE